MASSAISTIYCDFTVGGCYQRLESGLNIVNYGVINYGGGMDLQLASFTNYGTLNVINMGTSNPIFNPTGFPGTLDNYGLILVNSSAVSSYSCLIVLILFRFILSYGLVFNNNGTVDIQYGNLTLLQNSGTHNGSFLLSSSSTFTIVESAPSHTFTASRYKLIFIFLNNIHK